ncbi:MAG: glycoside hydrolase family 13 protein [Spirochaetes bacterium]|nr:glycoside hydrolase family 13 protein [Spirochaetota bacterium]
MWKKSIHSEVNSQFVSNSYPVFGEEISISIRMFAESPVKKVYLQTIVNGGIEISPLKPRQKRGRFIYFGENFLLNQQRFQYHFIIETQAGEYLFYTRHQVTAFQPTEDHDFVILVDFAQPHWVASAVFYQIFPDRFWQGDQKNQIENKEYYYDGWPVQKMNWDDPPLEYPEGHCLDFFGGDLKGIKDKIPYLKKLGVNALYLNPIFSAKTTHRYDCIDYFSVDSHLGGNAALVDLVKALHENNMYIIIDVSINHTGNEHPWFLRALDRPDSEEAEFYYINKDKSYEAWGGFHTLPKLNFNSKKLRDILIHAEDALVKKYLKEPFFIDGWRFDVGNHTGCLDKDQFANEIYQQIRSEVKKINPQVYIIGEHWTDNISFLQGDQWDGAMNYFASCQPLRSFCGLLDRFLWKVDDPFEVRQPASGIILKEQIEQHYHRLPNQIAFLQYNLIDSHDIFRFHNFKKAFAFERYKGMIILLFLLPGTPSIYYGDEIGLPGTCETDEGCRYPMNWEKNKQQQKFYHLYQKLAHLKQNESALHYGCYRILLADEDTFVYSRFDEQKAFIGIASHTQKRKEIVFPVDSIGIKANSIAEDLFTHQQLIIRDGKMVVPLAKNESYLFKCQIEE